MTSHENQLTAAQHELHERVLAIAGWDGSDCKDVLDRLDAPAADKAAVAEVLGGPGTGAEYLQADQGTAESDTGAEGDSTPEAVDGSAERDWPAPQQARQEMLRLAERCEAGADQLTYEAEHAAEVLADRGYPDADAQEWAQRKRAAATAAREYAAGLRTEAGELGETGRPSQQRIEQAEKVASAAELGGILIDSRRLNDAAAANPWTDEEGRQAARDYAEQKRAAVEGSGMFEHVAETINGVEQVPFWQLGHPDRAQDTAEQAEAATRGAADDGHDDTDGM